MSFLFILLPISPDNGTVMNVNKKDLHFWLIFKTLIIVCLVDNNMHATLFTVLSSLLVEKRAIIHNEIKF
jgi:hypothetical protein